MRCCCQLCWHRVAIIHGTMIQLRTPARVMLAYMRASYARARHSRNTIRHSVVHLFVCDCAPWAPIVKRFRMEENLFDLTGMCVLRLRVTFGLITRSVRDIIPRAVHCALHKVELAPRTRPHTARTQPHKVHGFCVPIFTHVGSLCVYTRAQRPCKR